MTAALVPSRKRIRLLEIKVLFNATGLQSWRARNLSLHGFSKRLLRKDISTNLLTTSHNSNQVIQQAILHDFKKISVLFTAGLFPLMLLWLTIEG